MSYLQEPKIEKDEDQGGENDDCKRDIVPGNVKDDVTSRTNREYDEELDLIASAIKEDLDDEEDDDVPPDFFDDFSNKDFLAGLDVVDAWEDGLIARPADAKPNRECVLVDDTEEQRIVSRERGFKIAAIEADLYDVSDIVAKKPVKERLGVRNDLKSSENNQEQSIESECNNIDSSLVPGEEAQESEPIEDSLPIKPVTKKQRGIKKKPAVPKVKKAKKLATKKLVESKNTTEVKSSKENHNKKSSRSSRSKSNEKVVKARAEQRKDSKSQEKSPENSEEGEVKSKDSDKLAKSRKSKSPPRRSRSRERYGRPIRRSRSRERPLIRRSLSKEKRLHKSRSRSRGRRSRSPRKMRDLDDFRRDPNKTKRDIQRDKAKCAKDKEAKIISEKLRVVETGLVPPGMEMETDLSEQIRERPGRKRSRSRSIEHRRGKNSEKSPSPKLKRKYRSPVQSRSPIRWPPSTGYKLMDRRYSRRSPSPNMAHRALEPERSSYEKRQWRSPSIERNSRRKEKRPSHHSNERSPSRKKNSFLDELDEKLNVQAEFNKLEQIKEKINGGPLSANIAAKYGHRLAPRPVPNPMMQMPNPVPPPVPRIPQQVTFQPSVYDEQYFIGSNQPGPMIRPPQPEYNMNMHVMPTYINHPPPPQSHQYYNQNITMAPNPVQPQKQSVDSLFNDENISLSAFLSITARVSDESKGLDIKSKIKVITRCQEAIKIMTEFTKPSGRFYYKGPKQVPEKVIDYTNVSPMKRMFPVRFSFTTRVRKGPEKPSTPLGMLLHKLGLKAAVTKTVPAVTKAVSASPEVPKQKKQVFKDVKQADVFNKFIQTDEVKCADCESRKKKTFASTATGSDRKMYVDFGCQVSEDDFLNTARSALKNIIKNQSLASLTPAQILSTLGKSDDKLELFPAARKVADEPKDVVVQKEISNNDSFPFRHSPGDTRTRLHDFNWRNQVEASGSSMYMQQSNYPRPLLAGPNNPGSFQQHPNNFGNRNFGSFHEQNPNNFSNQRPYQQNNRSFMDPSNNFRRF